MRAVGPDIGFPLSPILTELQRLVLGLLTPGKPSQLWPVAFADLPDATAWTGCIVYVTDKAKVGLSNGTAWTDPAGGAL